MKTSLNNNLPNSVSNWKEHPEDTEWVVVDWEGQFFKNNPQLIPQGENGCCMYDSSSSPKGIENYSVHLFSVNKLKLTSLDFPPNFWKKQGVKQCDALTFPTSDKKDDALLFIETKYTLKAKGWSMYKQHALNQIIDTIIELSNNGCPITDRKLFGLISCPLLNSMGATAFSLDELKSIRLQYGVQIKMGNSATFKDSQTISFIDEE